VQDVLRFGENPWHTEAFDSRLDEAAHELLRGTVEPADHRIGSVLFLGVAFLCVVLFAVVRASIGPA
jgi:hypothetical protein